MRPPDDRIGRTLADGRFEVVEWIGASEGMGVTIGIDRRDGSHAQLTVAGDVSATLTQLMPLCRAVDGLANCTYLGSTNSDDGWAQTGFMLAERIPTGKRFEIGEQRWPTSDVLRFGQRLLDKVRHVHAQGMVLGTLRPEAIFLNDETMTLVARGERLWMMPKPNTTKGASLPPWMPGYQAPEVAFALTMLDDPSPAADVFSVAMILAELLLGTFPFERTSRYGVLLAQHRGEHLPLPENALGAILARALSPQPDARPTLEELERELQQPG